MGAATAVQVDDGGAGTSAIEALGSLFKLTQVYLWDDGSAETPEPRSVTKSRKSPHCGDDIGSKVDSTTSDFCRSAEDVELLEQMNALGLPVSFRTNKEKKRGNNKAKKKSSSKDTLYFKEIENETPELCKVSEGDAVSLSPFHDNPIPAGSLCSMSMLGRSGSSCYDVAANVQKSICCAAEGESASLTGSGYGLIEEPIPVEGYGFQTTSQNHQSVEASITSKRECQINTELNNYDAAQLPQCDPTEACADYMEEESAGSFVEHKHLVVDHEVIQACKTVELILHEEAALNLGSEMLQNDEMGSCMCSEEYGEWRVYWDSFYQRNYYYNIKTKESTWFPPPGVEHEIFFDCVGNSDGSTEKSDGVITKLCETEVSHASASLNDSVEDCRSDYSVINAFTEVAPEDLQLDELDVECDSHVRKWKKRIRKKRWQRTFSGADEELKFPLLEEYSPNIEKYWYQRYLLFSRFDDGVKLDEEGWFSVTPELIAKHHALRCANNTIIDGFTGVGGNAIQFAEKAKHVIAIDIDPSKIEYANHNAALYEVDDRIDFVKGNFFLLAPKLKADTVFLSPPWGGPDYTKVKTYDIKTMLKPHDGFFLFEAAKEIASKVVMFLPKNVDLNQLAELSLSSNPPWSLEVERNFLNGKLKAITAYFTNPEIHVNNDQ